MKLKPEHEREDDRQPVLHQLAVVEDLRGLAGDVDIHVRLAERLRHDVRAEPLDRLHRPLVAAVTGDERLHHGQTRVRRGLELRVPERPVARELCAEPLDPLPHRRRAHVPLDDDLGRVDGTDAELALERVEAVLRRVAVRDRADARRPRSQLERRQREQDEERGRDEQVDERPPLHAHDDGAPEPALAGSSPDEGQAQRVDAVAEQRQNGRQQGRRGDHCGEADQDRPRREAAQNRVRHEQHPRHRDHERRPAEEHGTAGGPAGRPDRPTFSTLAVAPRESG